MTKRTPDQATLSTEESEAKRKGSSSLKNMDDAIIRQIIEAVRRSPAMWNIKSPAYKLSNIKKAAIYEAIDRRLAKEGKSDKLSKFYVVPI